MSSDETVQDVAAAETESKDQQTASTSTPVIPTGPAAMATSTKVRPRIVMASDKEGGARERKRGKSMFGLVLGTLNKAKIEEKERDASEAAKKRHLIEQRLQSKLRKETDSVRRAEEAKKDKTSANRKEEDLQLKDSIYKLRRTRLPLLSNFLLTSDTIPDIPGDENGTPAPSTNTLAPPPRSHPPPLYYLPAILTPAQEAFLSKRKREVSEAAEKEWDLFKTERSTGIEEIQQLRKRVAEEESRKKNEQQEKQASNGDTEMDVADGDAGGAEVSKPAGEAEESMEVDAAPTSGGGNANGSANAEKESTEAETSKTEKEKREETMQGDDDDAVEY